MKSRSKPIAQNGLSKSTFSFFVKRIVVLQDRRLPSMHPPEVHGLPLKISLLEHGRSHSTRLNSIHRRSEASIYCRLLDKIRKCCTNLSHQPQPQPRLPWPTQQPHPPAPLAHRRSPITSRLHRQNSAAPRRSRASTKCGSLARARVTCRNRSRSRPS